MLKNWMSRLKSWNESQIKYWVLKEVSQKLINILLTSVKVVFIQIQKQVNRFSIIIPYYARLYGNPRHLPRILNLKIWKNNIEQVLSKLQIFLSYFFWMLKLL